MVLYAKCCLALLLMLVICEVSYGRFGNPRKPSHRARRAILFDRVQRNDLDAVLPDFIEDEFESYEDKRGNDEDGAHVEHHESHESHEEHGSHDEDSGEPEFEDPPRHGGPGRLFEKRSASVHGSLFGKRDVDEPDASLTNTEATVKLIQDVFSDYDASQVNPLENGESVSIGLSYLCARFDEKEQVLTSRVWQKLHWTDSRLQWDPTDYNGLTEIRVRSWNIWTPDIQLYNAVESPQRDWYINAVVTNDGSVWYFPPATYKTVCRPDKRAARVYDCSLKMGSWTYDASLLPLNLMDDGPINDDYLADCPYTISNAHAEIETAQYEGLEKSTWHTYSANFTIQRNDYSFKFRN